MDFNEIYKLNIKCVKGIVGRIIRDKGEAEDVTQEVFIKVFNSLDTFNNDCKLSTWVGRIAFNEAFNRLKVLKRTDSRFTLVDKLSDASQFYDTPETACSTEHSQRVMDKVMSSNSDVIKMAIERNLFNSSYAELAEKYSIPEGTAKSMVNKGKVEITKLLQDV